MVELAPAVVGQDYRRDARFDRAPGVVNSADDLTVIVAGGAAGGACAIIPLWGTGVNSVSTTREIGA